MATTVLNVTNSVLRLLREDTVSASEWDNDDYAQFLLELINQTKREIEDAWNWSFLREEIQVTTTGGQATTDVTGTNKRTRILQVINTDEDIIVYPIPYNRYLHLENLGSTTNEKPAYYVEASDSVDTTDVRTVQWWPVPDTSYNMSFFVVNPQSDYTDDTDTLAIPHHPLILGVLAKAVRERGEEGGRSLLDVQEDYRKALADAISQDAQSRMVEETTWQVV